MNQNKRSHTKGKRHAVISCWRSQTQQTGNIAEQDKNKDGANIIVILIGMFSHGSIYHAIQLLHNQLHNILKPLRDFTCFSHGKAGSYGKTG